MPELCYNAAMATITLEVPDRLVEQWRDEAYPLSVVLAFFLEMIFLPGATASALTTSRWGEIAAFLAQSGEAKSLVNFRFSPQLQSRFVELLEINNQNPLTPNEQLDISDHIRAIWFLSLLKTRVRLSVY